MAEFDLSETILCANLELKQRFQGLSDTKELEDTVIDMFGMFHIWKTPTNLKIHGHYVTDPTCSLGDITPMIMPKRSSLLWKTKFSKE